MRGEKSGVGGRLILEGHRSGMEDGLGDGKQVAGGRVENVVRSRAALHLM